MLVILLQSHIMCNYTNIHSCNQELLWHLSGCVVQTVSTLLIRASLMTNKLARRHHLVLLILCFCLPHRIKSKRKSKIDDLCDVQKLIVGKTRMFTPNTRWFRIFSPEEPIWVWRCPRSQVPERRSQTDGQGQSKPGEPTHDSVTMGQIVEGSLHNSWSFALLVKKVCLSPYNKIKLA